MLRASIKSVFNGFKGSKMKKFLVLAAIIAVVYVLADIRQGFVNVQSAHIARIVRTIEG